MMEKSVREKTINVRLKVKKGPQRSVCNKDLTYYTHHCGHIPYGIMVHKANSSAK